jgi:hypothetical protein
VTGAAPAYAARAARTASSRASGPRSAPVLASTSARRRTERDPAAAK